MTKDGRRRAGYGEAKRHFLAEVERDTDECIVWPFTITTHGYGQVNWNGRPEFVHSLACEMFHGPRPTGMVAGHGDCHNRPCFNPRHVSWRTESDNGFDKARDGTAGRILTPAQEDEVRRMYVPRKMGYQRVADHFGVSMDTVIRIVNGRKGSPPRRKKPFTAERRRCQVEGCEKVAARRGYCGMHIQRVERYGDPMAHVPPMTPRGEPARYFFAHVTDDTDECLIVPGTTRGWYGQLWLGGTTHRAHVLACEMFHGPRPEGMVAAHGPCHNRGCFNPRHLSWRTVAENMSDDKRRDGTTQAGAGHPFARLKRDAVLDIRERYAAGVERTTDIAADYGVGPNLVLVMLRGDTYRDVPWESDEQRAAVRSRLAQKAAPIGKRGRGGSKSALASMTLDQIHGIRERYAAGESTTALAREVGATYETVNRMLRGDSYRDVPWASDHLRLTVKARLYEQNQKLHGMRRRAEAEAEGFGQLEAG